LLLRSLAEDTATWTRSVTLDEHQQSHKAAASLAKRAAAKDLTGSGPYMSSARAVFVLSRRQEYQECVVYKSFVGPGEVEQQS
jgi:hypothetical protein